MIPKIGQKVKIGDNYGTITQVHTPCRFHTGRFVVLIHYTHYDSYAEFWFDDYGTSVIPIKRSNQSDNR